MQILRKLTKLFTANKSTWIGADSFLIKDSADSDNIKNLLLSDYIKPRIQSVASSATVTFNSDTDDEVVVTALATNVTFANPTGTPTQGQKGLFRVKDNATARTISFGTQFRGIGVTLPTTTVISKTTYFLAIYNSTDTKWDVVLVCTQDASSSAGNTIYTANDSLTGDRTISSAGYFLAVNGTSNKGFLVFDYNSGDIKAGLRDSATLTTPPVIVSGSTPYFGVSGVTAGAGRIGIRGAAANESILFELSGSTAWMCDPSSGAYLYQFGYGYTGRQLNAKRRFGDNNSPTATIDLLAGTTTVAPLKLESGTNLTTPVNGTFEYDGTNLYFTTGGVRKTVTLI